ncbi:hypothetical protein DFH09DRAFT_1068777 [Mycena vulgaris]|nr:hypothetical protein DFH09DRAFT_1068777 [Mycena vulgaris]
MSPPTRPTISELTAISQAEPDAAPNSSRELKHYLRREQTHMYDGKKVSGAGSGPTAVNPRGTNDLGGDLGLFRASARHSLSQIHVLQQNRSRRAAGTELISNKFTSKISPKTVPAAMREHPRPPKKILPKPVPAALRERPCPPPKKNLPQNRSRRAVGAELISKTIHLKKISKNRSRRDAGTPPPPKKKSFPKPFPPCCGNGKSQQLICIRRRVLQVNAWRVETKKKKNKRRKGDPNLVTGID